MWCKEKKSYIDEIDCMECESIVKCPHLIVIDTKYESNEIKNEQIDLRKEI